ncbi:MAG: CocE/NonD family hydrolase, partial [Armatimonadota bacterium]
MRRWPQSARFTTYLFLAALACLLLLPPVAAQQAADVQTSMVPMSDGVQLATDVRPGEGDGPWPVILLRTPYGRKTTMGGLGEYAIVTQDVRGRGDSEGHARAFFDDGWGEHQDGLDTVKWILAQPWCNGRIGTAGGSALGITQNMLAGANPPGVLAQQIVVAAGSMYHHTCYPGGVWREALVGGWLKQTNWPPDNRELMLAHPAYDDLWQTTDSIARIEQQRVNIPAIHIGGWFDIFTQGTIDSFVSRSSISPNQWMIVGPWPHGVARKVGELEFPENAVDIPKPGMDAELWFDFWIRAEDNGMRQLPRVHYYVMGACGEDGAPGNEWRSRETWPVPADPTEFFLAPGGRLRTSRPITAGSASYEYDPANPVPTRGGANLLIPAGPMDQ